MKKIRLSLISIGFAINFCYAQTNTFPSSGYIGIGTTSPTAGLDIANVTSGLYNLRVTGGYTNFNSTTQRSTYGTSGHLWDVTYGDVTTFSYYDGTTWRINRITFDNSGNLTTAGNLTVSGSTIAATNYGGLSYPYNTAFGSTADASYTQIFAGSTVGYATGIYINGGGATTPNTIMLNTASIERMRFTSNGNIGIGTTVPQSKLHVGSDTSDVISIGTSDYGGSTGQALSGIKSSEMAGGLGGNIEFQTLSWGTGSPYTLATKMIIQGNSGNVGIGTTNPQGYKLAVNGSAIATSMTVKLYSSWPDYVFKSTYHLPTLTEVKTYVDKNHHLPGMPSEQEVAKNGINLGETDKLLTKKMEELTLYLITQQKEIDDLKQQISILIQLKK